MPSFEMNGYNNGRDYDAIQSADGAALAAIVARYPAKTALADLAAAVKEAKFTRDSVGQIFREGRLVPFPAGLVVQIGVSVEGKPITRSFVMEAVSVGAPTPIAEPEPVIEKPAVKTR